MFKKIKQGGVLGRNLKHAQTIKKRAGMLVIAIAAIFALTIIDAGINAISGKGLVTAGAMTAILPLFYVDKKFVELKGADLETFNKDATPEQQLEYIEALSKDRQEKLAVALESKASKEDIAAIQDAIKDVEKGMLKALNDALKSRDLMLKKLLDSTEKGEINIPVKEQLKANKDLLMNIAKKVSGEEVVIKTLLQRSGVANNDHAIDLTDIGQLATRKLSLYDLFPKVNISESNNNGTVRYYDWDEDTIARAAAAVAEGAPFPASTAAFKRGTVTLQKIGDTLPITEEFFQDEALFASELNLFLQINVALEMDRQLMDGDGTGNTIVGLKSSINAYTLPGAGSITDANIYDLIVKISEQITTTGGAKYQPDFALMNIADINKMSLKKDANNNYIIPPFVSRDGKQVAAITVVESNICTADTMVVGDKRFARIYEKGGIVLSKGEINAQFTSDEMTLKARKRMAFLIRNADKGGFRKVTSITAALAALNIV